MKCPENNECNIKCIFTESCAHAKFIGNIGTQLYIIGNGKKCFEDAEIICPPDTIYGNEYLNDATCKISSTGEASMKGLNIQSMASWSNLDLKCTTAPCFTSYPPQLVCGIDLETACSFHSTSDGTEQTQWQCIDDDHICNSYQLPSFSPTLYPTAHPTYSYDDPPPNTLYISNTNGCDHGQCQTDSFDRDGFCNLNELQNVDCCMDYTPSPTLEPTPSPTTSECRHTGVSSYKIGDGLCHSMTEGYNTQQCNWDGGDCCEETCVSSDPIRCGADGYLCLDPKYSKVPECSVDNTVNIDGAGVYNHSGIANYVWNRGPGTHVSVVCFNIINDFSCWSPKVITHRVEPWTLCDTELKYIFSHFFPQSGFFPRKMLNFTNFLSLLQCQRQLVAYPQFIIDRYPPNGHNGKLQKCYTSLVNKNSHLPWEKGMYKHEFITIRL